MLGSIGPPFPCNGEIGSPITAVQLLRASPAVCVGYIRPGFLLAAKDLHLVGVCVHHIKRYKPGTQCSLQGAAAGAHQRHCRVQQQRANSMLEQLQIWMEPL